MKVLHVDHSGLPGGGQLGLERYSQQVSVHERHYLFLETGPVADRMVSRGVPVTVSRMPSSAMLDMARYRASLRREIDDVGADVIVANSLRSAVGVAMAKPSGRKLYYVRQDMSRASMGTLEVALGSTVVFPRFDGFIANSMWTLTTIPKRLLRHSAAVVAYPLSGVGDAASRTPVTPLSKPLRLLWLGRLAPWKGLHVVLDALELLAHEQTAFELTVAGAPIHERDDYAERTRQRADKLANKPSFLGHVDDVPALLRSHDVLVHSSTRPEPFGQVVLQGMAAGMAVIATAGGGPAEILESGKTGRLVLPGDPADLARVLRELAQDRDAVARLGDAAQEEAQRGYQDEVLARAFDAALAQLAAWPAPGVAVSDRLGAPRTWEVK